MEPGKRGAICRRKAFLIQEIPDTAHGALRFGQPFVHNDDWKTLTERIPKSTGVRQRERTKDFAETH